MRSRRGRAIAALCLSAAVLSGSFRQAVAVMSNEPSLLAQSDDTDYAAGKAAFQREDWNEAIANLTMVLIRRPWHDNAQTMMAYSFRKLGQYDKALDYYAGALLQNPHHKGALEYLTETYVDMGRLDDAAATAQRLATICSTIVMAFDNSGWKHHCAEMDDLVAFYAARGVPLPALD